MSSPKKISEREKFNLRKSAKAELERLEKCLLEPNTVQILDEFKNKFNICETVYKVILEEHQKHTEYQKHKCKKPQRALKLDMRQVPHALKFAGYNFDKSLLNDLFGTSSSKGKTIKKLRNEITHGINKKAVEEILRTFDDKAA